MQKRKIILGSVIGLLIMGTSFLTVQAAVNQPGSRNLFSRVANILEVEEDDLIEAFKKARIEEINEQVNAGEITREEADKLIAKINDSKFPQFFNRGDMHHSRGMMNHLRDQMKDVADYLGMSKEEAMDAVKSGRTIEEIAVSKGKSVEELKDYLKAKIMDDANRSFDKGVITKEMRDHILDHVDEMVNMFVSGGFRDRHMGVGKKG